MGLVRGVFKSESDDSTDPAASEEVEDELCCKRDEDRALLELVRLQQPTLLGTIAVFVRCRIVVVVPGRGRRIIASSAAFLRRGLSDRSFDRVG